MTGQKKKKRILYIDSMKGFAIILVVIGHIIHTYYNSHIFQADQGKLWGIYNVIYSFHMPLMMAISGYLFETAYYRKHPNGNVKVLKGESLKTHLLNLTVIYFVFSLLNGFTKMLASKVVTSAVTLKDILLIPVFTISPFWYLYVLIFITLGFGFFSFFRKHETDKDYNTMLLLALATINVMSCCVFGILMKGQYNGAFELERILFYAFFFGLGVVYKRNKSLLFFRWYVALPCFLVGLGMLYMTWEVNTRPLIVIPVFNTFAAFMLIPGIWLFFEKLKFIGKLKPLVLLGRYSLEIYVLHPLVLGGGKALLLKIFSNNKLPLQMVILAVLSIVIPVLIATACKALHIYDIIFRPLYLFRRKRKG